MKRAIQNYILDLKKREAFYFLSFFYKFPFLNPNMMFGFFLCNRKQVSRRVAREIS